MITGRILKLYGWPEGRTIGLAKAAASALAGEGLEREAILGRLDAVRQDPDAYRADPTFGELAREIISVRIRREAKERVPVLHSALLPYRVWGGEHIEAAARAQMDAAMRLPVSVAGALMPDAHVGYGLPIGGVLATEGVVIPYAVGVDIACRIRLSVYPLPPAALDTQPERFERALLQQTHFGTGVTNPNRPYHAVLDDPAWNATRLLRTLQDVAGKQLGTSGTGNHFVEWGPLTLTGRDPSLDLEPGDYLALLSHSGSRGVGFKIANAYSNLAMEAQSKLDRSVRHLAWLSLESEPGQEYWLSMELAGRFASANHAVIHHAVAHSLGLEEIASVENHHNFAWKEDTKDESGANREVIVHRKGATPAGLGVLGLIPGSMGDPGYLVRGRGEESSLSSAPHGAGRAMSRRAALERVTRADRDRYLRDRGVRLLGGGLDESPQAYKGIEAIIAAQTDLVEVLGSFTPKIVRMANEPGDA